MVSTFDEGRLFVFLFCLLPLLFLLSFGAFTAFAVAAFAFALACGVVLLLVAQTVAFAFVCLCQGPL